MDTLTEWHRQDQETDNAYHAFCHYRNLPAFKRSIDAAHREHRAECMPEALPIKHTPKKWKDWSSANDWKVRIRAYDEYRQEHRRMQREHQLAEAEDAVAALASQMMERLEQRVANLDVEEIPAAVLDRWLDKLSGAQYRALGAHERLELTGRDGGAIEVSKPDMSALSDDDVAALRSVIQKKEED